MAIAVGVHAFGGGFTRGVRRIFDVPAQLEIHDLGRYTVNAMGIDFIREKAWEKWPKIDAAFVFGNPRCSAFSSMTPTIASRGAWCKQTQDIHDLCLYALSIKTNVVAWESVRGAYTIGEELLSYLTNEMFVPNGYRIAHIFVRGIDFGNAQRRHRYFYVAYRGRFNAEQPNFDRVTTRDVIGHMMSRKTYPRRIEAKNSSYDADSFAIINDDLRKCIPYVRQGEGLNGMATRDDGETLEKISSRLYETWLFRSSAIPLGISTIPRMTWDSCPVLHGGCSHFIHPELDRPITVGEASALMGWDEIPSGDYPMRQLAKGIIPNAGWWLSQRIMECLSNMWGREDFGILKSGERYNSYEHDEKVIYAEVL